MASTDVISTGTAEGLIAFCDYLIRKGLAPPGAVNPWKSAARNILVKVEDPDPWQSVDMKALDIDDYFQKFVNKTQGTMKPESLSAYDSRFRKAVTSYREYLADPMGFRPKFRTAPQRKSVQKANGTPSAAEAATPTSPGTPNAAAAPPTAQIAPGMIEYPFPLRSGHLARLQLPSTLEKDDAERLTHFIRALVFERQPQLPPGHPDGE